MDHRRHTLLTMARKQFLRCIHRGAIQTTRGDVDEPASGYIWNAAIRKGLKLRNYGEFGEPVPNKNANEPARYRAIKPALDRYTSREYPAFNMKIMDQVRVDVWLKEFQQFVRWEICQLTNHASSRRSHFRRTSGKTHAESAHG